MHLLKRSWVQNTALTIGSITFVLLVGEIACRIGGFSGYEDYIADPVVGWTLKPNQNVKTKVGGFPVSVNSDGFRAAPLVRSKDSTRVRIFALGNSATFGWGVHQDSVYHQIVARMLNRTAAASGSRTHYEIINAGVNAYNTYQAYQLMQRIDTAYHPDGYIFAFAFNDVWNRFGRLPPRQRDAVLTGVRVKNVLRKSALYNWLIEARGRALYDRIRGRITGREALAHGGTSPDSVRDLEDYERTLDSVTAFAHELHRSLSFVVLASKSRSPFWPYQQVMLQVGAGAAVPTANMISSFAAGPPDSLYLADDPVHPTEYGHRLVAEQLYAELCRHALKAQPGDPVAIYRAGCLVPRPDVAAAVPALPSSRPQR
ncbi:MAG: SGNH/GDSL hydrolase family protein [Gemmatimonadaceae bacterium]